MPVIALLSDIHGNLRALQAVLREAESFGINEIVSCGDVVGYGPHPAACVQILRELGIPSVMGNHDFYTATARTNPSLLAGRSRGGNQVLAGIRHAVETLDQCALDWLSNLPASLSISGAVVAHAALHDFGEWPHLLGMSDAQPTLEILAMAESGVGFFGHTHLQDFFTRPLGPQVRMIRDGAFKLPDAIACAVVVGSVGQPRDGDSRAAWTIWDSDARTVEFRRTAYPVERTIRDIGQAGLPEITAERLLRGI